MLGDTARKGLAAHLAIAQRLIELGFEVLQPVGNHLRYDLALGGGSSSTRPAAGSFGRRLREAIPRAATYLLS